MSKFTTCLQIVYVLAQLLHLTSWFEIPRAVAVLMWTTVLFTVVSGLHYVVVWSLKARREARSGRHA